MVILALVDFKICKFIFPVNFENTIISGLKYAKYSDRDQFPHYSCLFSIILGLHGLQISLIL
jgi:hypothetical protein